MQKTHECIFTQFTRNRHIERNFILGWEVKLIIAHNFCCICRIKACTLINNIQQARVQLEKQFETMGGDKLEEDAAKILNQLQNDLNIAIDELAAQFATR